MGFRITMAVPGHFLFHNGLRNALTFPLRTFIVLSVHELSVSSKILRVSVGAVPVGISGFLSDFSLAFY
jgi:hypothetical protein